MMGNGDLESRGGNKNRGATTYPPAYSSSAYNTEYSSDTQWTSWLVPLIVVANVAMFVVIMFVNNCPKNNLNLRSEGKCVPKFLGRLSFEPLNENPLFGPSSNTLYKLGGLSWPEVVQRHQAWRLVSCIWLHAGVVHLLANMLSLVFIGIRLEQQFGFARVGAIYLFSGIGGSILSCIFIQQSISVGASGAVFGLLGAMLSELITNWTIYANKAAALITLVVIIVVNLAVGILPHVDNFAHIGGFFTGFLLGSLLLLRPQFGWLERRQLPADVRAKSKYTVHQYVLWIVSLILLIVGFTVGFVMLFKGENGNDHCSWCHYLSCVPTSRWRCNNY
ncbi:hypothetical protein RJ639_020502 [Escallonia herrerae]|uniref:RHOMBOID-like protein n=1 Tax=Escallonia herrerae TaxID=1293975 RepID=A0AA88V561_9ASTE|nr:hypothetical protein RJ639_020502 [Escallonia herrerae]